MERISQTHKKLNEIFDIIIVGSGIMGLSTGISLLEKSPNLKIIILERGVLPTGATTKNAGFGIPLAYREFVDNVKGKGVKKSIENARCHHQGMQKLLARIENDPEIIQKVGCFDGLLESEIPLLKELDSVNQAMFEIFGKKNYFELQNDKFETYGFNPDLIKALVYQPDVYNIHSGKLTFKLVSIFQKLGGRIITGANVVEFQEISGKSFVKSTVQSNHPNLSSISYYSKKLVLCTNAFQKYFNHKYTVDSWRGQILITKPIKNFKPMPSLIMNLTHYYLRVVDDRIILGGGMIADFDNEITFEMKTSETIKKHLEWKLRQIFPGLEFEVDYFWAGLLGVEDDYKLTIIDNISPNVFTVFGCNGAGMSLGSYVGEKATEIILAKK